MTNHVHLAIQVGDVPLSRILQNLAFRYTRWINWRRSRSGHLFQGRYKAFVVDADPYLLELVAYIHLNPIRAGMVNDVGDFRWSSHRAYLRRETIPWLNTEFILGQFSKNHAKARKTFSEFVTGKSGEGHREGI
jgi:putative transposase